MNMFWFVTTSNKPRLRDPTQAARIIGTYWFDFDCAAHVERGPDGQHRLHIDGDGWPAAWPLPPGTSADEYYPDYSTSGQEELAAFLAGIAPYLAEPLILQAIGSVDGQFPLSACEWRVGPGSAMIARTEFAPDTRGPALACA